MDCPLTAATSTDPSFTGTGLTSPTAEAPPTSYAIRLSNGLCEPPSLFLFSLAALRTVHPKHWPVMLRDFTYQISTEYAHALQCCHTCRRWTALGTYGAPAGKQPTIDARRFDPCDLLELQSTRRHCAACWWRRYRRAPVWVHTAWQISCGELCNIGVLRFAGGTTLWTFGREDAPYIVDKAEFITRRHHPERRAPKRPRDAPAAPRARAPQTSLALRKL